MFGGLRRKFKRWQDAGLISEEQASTILAFERERKSGKLVKDLTNVAIFAIFLGVASLVAANWAYLPDTIKLAGHLVLNLGVAAFMLRTDGVKHPVIKDAAVLALFGFFLTFIALIGQIYQLHGDLHTTLLFWLGICTPFIWFYGRSYTVVVPWLAVLLITIFMNIFEYFDHRRDDEITLILSVMAIHLPIILLFVARLPWLLRHRPGFVESFYRLGLFLPAIFVNIAICAFYADNRENEYFVAQMVLMAAALLLATVIFRPRSQTDEKGYDLWIYLMVSGIFIMLPFALADIESDLLSAVLFIAYWVFVAWLGARMQSALLTDWAIRLVILRLFIIYLEVFGGMMMTGFGLIFSGILLLVILRYLNRIVAVGRRLVNYEIG